MKKYIGKRIMISLVTLLIIILVLFMLLQLMPGSPFNDEKLTADQIAMMSKKYGLDKPLIVQFFTYVKNLLQGDFGVSYVISKDTSISVLLKNRVPVSFGIGLEAVSFGAVVGLILGILAALKKNSWLDTICTVISVLGVSLPSYVFALVMAYFIGYKAQWLPLLFDGKKFFASSIMPMLALSMFTVATVARFTRTSLLEVLDSDYMLLAESKGITGRPLLVRHALRNALIPIITVLAPLVVDLMIGSLVIEKIFYAFSQLIHFRLINHIIFDLTFFGYLIQWLGYCLYRHYVRWFSGYPMRHRYCPPNGGRDKGHRKYARSGKYAI